MTEEKNGGNAGCDRSNRTSSCNPEEEETHSQERLMSASSRIKLQPKSCTVPEWIQRWALGE